MSKIAPKIRFEKSSYYFIGLLLLAFLGFWTTYFSKFFTGKNDFSFYFHFHATMMIIWVVLLIAQPLLIRKKRLDLHRFIGKTTYFLMPIMVISLLLVINNILKNAPVNELKFNNYISPFRDVFILILSFSIGIYYRRNIQIHSRAMIITGIVFIEPALFRFLKGMIFQNNILLSVIITILFVLGLLITLIIIERKQKTGRWLFPLLLGIYFITYAIIIFEIPMSFLDPFVKWLARLPLT